MEELQLHDLKNMEAALGVQYLAKQQMCGDVPAVEVKQNASPPMHDVATVPNRPANGMESKAPIVMLSECGGRS